MSTTTTRKTTPAVKKIVKERLINIIEDCDYLSDDDVAEILNSMLTVGWKLSDGTWRKVI